MAKAKGYFLARRTRTAERAAVHRARGGGYGRKCP